MLSRYTTYFIQDILEYYFMKTFILMDESGDLGFDKNKKNSNFFLITFIISSDLKSIQKIVKNTHASLRKKIKRLSGGILHAYKEKPSTRIKVLSRLKQRNIKSYVVVLYFCNSSFRINLCLLIPYIPSMSPVEVFCPVILIAKSGRLGSKTCGSV